MNEKLFLACIILVFILSSCVNDPKEKSSDESNEKRELLLGTWIKSVNAGSKMIDIGFEFRDDNIVNYINQPRTVGQEWSFKGEDSLVLFYQNRIYGDSIESAVYYIETLNEYELRLRPRNAPEKYLDIYVKK